MRGAEGNAVGFQDLTPNRKLARRRVRPNAEATPTATPTMANLMPYQILSLYTAD
jgi:hypothetical protein